MAARREKKSRESLKKQPEGRDNPLPLHMIISNLVALFTSNGSERCTTFFFSANRGLYELSVAETFRFPTKNGRLMVNN